MKFTILIVFTCTVLAVNCLKTEVKIHSTIEATKNLKVAEVNEIVRELESIHTFNPTNKIRAEKLAQYMNESEYCTNTNDGWNVIILDDSWYDRHTFQITSTNVHFLGVKVGGLGIKEQIYVIFNEC